MGKARTLLSCSACGQQVGQWVGRCPGCGAWGTVEQRNYGLASVPVSLASLQHEVRGAPRASIGIPGIDRVLGGGLVPATVALLAGEPGIGKSTLLLQLVANLSAAGLPCLLASGEESRDQVALRAHRLGIPGERVAFASGRELGPLIEAARAERPFLLAVDSIQSLRDSAGAQAPGGPAQVRGCADALVGLAKTEGIAVLLAGHVTKDGDVAGPRTLEHAVDVVLTFDGEPRSGLRMLSGAKNRFGAEGEVAWFEMGPRGLHEIDPGALLRACEGEPGSATALPRLGRRALAVEIQALVVPTDGPARRQATGLDPGRFQLVAAVLDRMVGAPLARAELLGATSGGVGIDDPASDLAVAAALASAASGVPPPPQSAFVGEIGLTGRVHAGSGMGGRLAAARAAGLTMVFCTREPDPTLDGLQVITVGHVGDALEWAGFAGRLRAKRDRVA
jgi:DNA repair protein RadA/Sms